MLGESEQSYALFEKQYIEHTFFDSPPLVPNLSSRNHPHNISSFLYISFGFPLEKFTVINIDRPWSRVEPSLSISVSHWAGFCGFRHSLSTLYFNSNVLILGFSKWYPRVSSDVGHRARKRYLLILAFDSNA